MPNLRSLYQFLVLHFYTFILFLLYVSFHLYTAWQLALAGDSTRTRTFLQRERRERLDAWVTAVHAVRRDALKRGYHAADLLSDEDAAYAYGVKRLAVERLPALGYQAKVQGYERVGPIDVPEISPDSRRCDLWNERQDVAYLVKCSVSEGEAACFNCIESRRYRRECVHLPRTLRLALNTYTVSSLSRQDYNDDEDDYVDIPANEATDEGYCLPTTFAQMILNEAGDYVPKDKTRNCNPNTGEWLLARMSVVGDTSYNWICRCRYINLMTNLTTVFSDCMRPVGCLPNGILDPDTQAGRVNPYTRGRCVCDTGFRDDRDPTIGPTCVPTAVLSETTMPEDLYSLHKLQVYATISWPDDAQFLDPRISTLIGNNNRKIKLPNPCRYDAATGRELHPNEACKLVSAKGRGDEEPVAYCIANSRSSIPVRTDRDYLRNNNGRYANACLRLQDAPETSQTNAEHSILSYQTSATLEDASPDFGLVVPVSQHLQRIVDSVRDDQEWQRFKANVQPPERIVNGLSMVNFKITGEIVSDWFCVYEQSPVNAILLDGLRARVLGNFRSSDGLWGYVYNLRRRGLYWYNVTNPFGNVHMNHGPASETNSLIDFLTAFDGNEFIRGQQIREDQAWVHQPKCVRPDGFYYGKFAAQITYNQKPTVYPNVPFVIPFASGSPVDYKEFSNNYFKTLRPVYSVPEDRPLNKYPAMPFVFNSNFDLADGTVMIHKFPQIDPYAMAFYMLSSEQLAGQYKNHREFMQNRFQGKWV